ncbi:MAG: ankyrin repeat domain-containing protein [Candidatus Thiodiazotropha taylori]|uniref:Ankyrin repeat domain-containing protein n=1 Tax=Candidatus Thiodiazotropha taylori TaxID=2792791 RepID=A0A9E4KDB2_9GAMM|nr:ankyrin repeat domain-containing protein [Candidatus Thiodiazotropha taylori]MCW4256761.1 ankyrin repeat domain-containing protein [Candidatus Thiodiazotropha taylori]
MLTLEEILNDFAAYIGEGHPENVGLDSASATGETPLHWMATIGDSGAIKMLVDAGAEVNAQDRAGNTALHCAVASRQASAAKALLLLGANAFQENLEGVSPSGLSQQDEFRPVQALFGERA